MATCARTFFAGDVARSERKLCTIAAAAAAAAFVAVVAAVVAVAAAAATTNDDEAACNELLPSAGRIDGGGGSGGGGSGGSGSGGDIDLRRRPQIEDVARSSRLAFLSGVFKYGFGWRTRARECFMFLADSFWAAEATAAVAATTPNCALR